MKRKKEEEGKVYREDGEEEEGKKGEYGRWKTSKKGKGGKIVLERKLNRKYE